VQPRGGGVRGQLVERHAAAARGAAQHQPAVGNGIGQAVVDFGGGQHVAGAGGHHVGLVVRVALGRDQQQPVQAHGAHGTRRRTDVARVLGADQHDADALGAVGGVG
jgi:hypothetical protein